jgi:hypothetical protein
VDEKERRVALIQLRARIRRAELVEDFAPEFVLIDEELDEEEPLDLVDELELLDVE